MSEIMIAVDLSGFSESLIRTGVELANKMNASVTLFSVIELGIGLGLPEGGPVYVDDIPARISEVEEILKTYKNSYPDTNINILVTSGNPKNATLEQAHAGNTAILVVGTHGRTGIDHMLVGSNAEYIIRHSRIPVLVVPYNQAAH
ncbi:nucleotide-binding universal stress UspA family protein [Chitinophaga niastensis]|uniref:Nucleotide-binding universal stress UspA family protein n=1 Tax=Chitinophaga niastensis TaxID=536980 RepID=A0A2P8HLZ3_CHINA|nr:universal stress protein [Chitinophaga niastensis]PSL47235.1 nucleotide-binding universal stress UspA family protein [Chitinophaga niastensis]